MSAACVVASARERVDRPALTLALDGERTDEAEEDTSEIDWEVEPGKKVKAMAYNGMVPGPQIRVREGDRVRVVLKNELKESTVIHFHGLELPAHGRLEDVVTRSFC